MVSSFKFTKFIGTAVPRIFCIRTAFRSRRAIGPGPLALLKFLNEIVKDLLALSSFMTGSIVYAGNISAYFSTLYRMEPVIVYTVLVLANPVGVFRKFFTLSLMKLIVLGTFPVPAESLAVSSMGLTVVYTPSVLTKLSASSFVHLAVVVAPRVLAQQKAQSIVDLAVLFAFFIFAYSFDIFAVP